MSRRKSQKNKGGKGVFRPDLSPLPSGVVNPRPGVQVTFAEASAFSGPIPPPILRQQYDEIDPGLANRIVAMAEKQQSHRHDLESIAVRSDIRRGYLGMGSGLLVALAGIGIGGYLLSLGQKIEGSVFAGGTLAAIVGVFVYGTDQRRKERAEKTRILAGRK